MTILKHAPRWMWLVGWVLMLLLGACSTNTLGGQTNAPTTTAPASGTTPSPAPASCATKASATAEAWATTGDNAQVKGSINGGAATTLSNFTYPLGLPNENATGIDYLAALAWSPDAQHLAVAVGVSDGPGQTLFPYVV